MRKAVLWSPYLRAWFSPEDESAMECMIHLPDYEPIFWVAPEAGNVLIDVGAYVGAYTILGALAVGPRGKVVAMEPDVVNRLQLQNNLALNEISNCIVIPNAAWSRSGKVGWQRGAEPVWHAIQEELKSGSVEAVRVDEVISEQALDRVDWIKMDIEGAELEALKGAENTLARFKPRLFIEVHNTTEAIRKFLDSHGYRIERESFDEPPDRHGWLLATAP
jgi:FkbM family methyltransferase